MQKKLIALAVAGALVAPAAAMADAEIYGKLRMSVDFNDNGDTTDGNDDSALALTSHASRIGFKGSEELSGGLKAIWQLESEMEIDDGDDLTSKQRNTYVGLAGDFGQVRAGRHDTPYKLMGKHIDIFVDTGADYNAVIQFDTRAPNAIAYISPDMSGFTFAGAYVTAHNASDLGGGGFTSTDDLPRLEEEGEMDAISLMAQYKMAGLYLGIAYESLNGIVPPDSGDDLDDATSLKLAASYELAEATQFGLIYQTNEAGDAEQDNIYFSVAHKMGDTTLKFAYGQLGELEGELEGDDLPGEDGADFFALGVTQALSKTTELYALYATMGNEDNGDNGLKKVDYGDGDLGEDVATLSFGLNHKFSSM